MSAVIYERTCESSLSLILQSTLSMMWSTYCGNDCLEMLLIDLQFVAGVQHLHNGRVQVLDFLQQYVIVQVLVSVREPELVLQCTHTKH